MLIETDRIHAARRASELHDAVEVFKGANRSVRVAEASVEVLRAAAAAWRSPEAPPEQAGAKDFARFLANHLQTHLRSHAAG